MPILAAPPPGPPPPLAVCPTESLHVPVPPATHDPAESTFRHLPRLPLTPQRGRRATNPQLHWDTIVTCTRILAEPPPLTAPPVLDAPPPGDKKENTKGSVYWG